MSLSNLSPLKQAFLRIEELEARLHERQRIEREPIAVVGIGCRFPGGVDGPEAYWQLLANGVDATREVPAGRWDVDRFYDPNPDVPGKTYSRRGGYLDTVDLFDAPFFKISPREAAVMDPQQRLLLEVGWEAFEHAGVPPRSLENSRTGVFVAVSTNDYWNLQVRQNDLTQISAYHGSGIAYSVASGRLSYVLGLQGPSISIDTACSGSLVAVHLACQSLRAGECSMALAGGVNLILSPDNSVIFAKSKMLAADGRCKTFDSAADGFGEGEGCGLVVLKRLSQAIADGNRVLAIIRGSAVNQDGPSSGLTAPNGPSQETVIRDALAAADVRPAEVGYIEAHGTGTSLGDPIEVQALANVLREGRPPEAPVWIGSVKSNFAHLEAAAGIAGLIKVVLSLQHQVIPAHLHFQTPNPFIPWADLPVAVAKDTREWPVMAGRRIGGVSAFGFSGTNAHVVLEEAPVSSQPAPENATDRPLHLLALSGASADALRALAGRHAASAAGAPEAAIGDLCWSSNAGRSHESHRLAIMAGNRGELHSALNAFIQGEKPERATQGFLEPGKHPKIAFLFTGQGAQYAGMGHVLYRTQPVFRAALDRCAEILRSHLDKPLVSVMFPADGSGGLLNQTAYTQPSLFSLEYALSELWQSWGIAPSALMGHSLGEYVAAVTAGVWSLEDGLALVASRARLMQELPAGGEMAAVFTSEDNINAVLRRRPGVAIAAINGPQNVVISGAAAGVRAVIQELASSGIDAQPLTVSHAFHSPLMEPILDRFEAVVRGREAAPARIPIASNLTGSMARGNGVFDSLYWRRHLREPVRFADGVRALRAAGIGLFLEVGPNPTLIGMGRRILNGDDAVWLPSLVRGNDDWQAILGSVAGLYCQGIDVNWKGFDQPYRRNQVAIPTYPFQRQRHWFDTQAAPRIESAPAAPAAATQQHPLLQRRLRTAVGLFESDLDPAALTWLGEHRVRGRIVLPAAAYLEAVRAAATAVLGREQLRLEDVVIGEPLTLPEEGKRTFQVLVSPGHDGEASFQVYSAGNADAWRLHASGRVNAELSVAHAFDQIAYTRCATTKDVEAHYQSLIGRGIELGPAFQGVEKLTSGENEALGDLRFTAEVNTDHSVYGIHPALLDAALQVVGAALPSDGGEGIHQQTYLPMGFDQVSFHAFPQRNGLKSHVQIRPIAEPQPETITADVRLFDGTGELLIELSGLRLKRMVAAIAGEIDDWMYEVRWQEQALSATEASVSPHDLEQAVRKALPALEDRATFSRYDELIGRLDTISGAWVLRTLEALGCQPRVGETLTPATLWKDLGVLERHRRLFDRMLGILGEDGYLEAQGSNWLVTRELAAKSPSHDLRDLLTKYPEYEAEISLLNRCVPQLPGVLRGHVDPLELLFPGGDMSTAERLYEQSPLARAYNGLVQAAVVAASEKLKIERKVRILEIGGGTGGATTGLLPLLDSARTEYVFTDISRLFLTKASQKFQQYPFVRYQTLDIEQDPSAQGFEGERFDIVVAVNVLHATRDLEDTLAHVRTLLAPTGALVALEMIRAQRDVDLVFGLTDGWWRFTDTHRRPSSLLMPPSQWKALLSELRFRETSIFPGQMNTESRAANQALLVAGGAPDTVDAAETPRAAWLIFEDEAGDGGELIRNIEARGQNVVRVSRGTAFTSLAKDRFVVDTNRTDDYRRLREEAFPAGRRCLGIVHLWSLDAAASIDLDEDAMDAEQSLGARSMLSVVQAFGDILSASQRLCLVTRGAQAFGAEQGLRLSQAPVWGLANVIDLELPELRCLRIDLDQARDANDAERLAAELFADGRENKVMFRGPNRYVARLVRAGKPPAPASEADPVRFEVGTRGLLDSVVAKPMTRRASGPGEVEIRVVATGLNLRDVLGAMGLYPGDPGPLGSECAGVITAVGPDVRDLHIGDEVLAIAPGCLATYVTTPVQFVMRRPTRLTVEQAASVAIPYVTAHFGLLHMARLRAGERVLIHSAAGGVGLAAVHVAQRIGAEVVATAGNEEKRAYLRSLGVDMVLDSRSTEFADVLRSESGGRGIDVVLNSLGPEFVEPGLSVLAPGGRFIELAKTGILNPEQRAALRPDIEYHVVDWSHEARATPDLIRSMLEQVITLLDTGEAPPLPVRTFSAADTISALRYMGNARHIGKVVLVHDTGEGREPALVKPNCTYLITGGLRGLGLLTAERFVDLGARHLILMGRAEPSVATLESIGALEARGARVLIAQGDVSRKSDIARVLEQAASLLPPIAGVVHSAGVLNDGVLQRLDWPRFAEVLEPKLRGSWNLYRSLRDQPLDFFICYSSIAGLFGSPGQANHAAANAFLDTFAWFLRASGIPGQAINWGAWSEVGAAAERKVGERILSRGVATITPGAGLDALEAVMRRRAAHVAVTPMRWGQFLQGFAAGSEPMFFSHMAPQGRRPASGARRRTETDQAIRDRLLRAPATKRQSLLGNYVSERVARVLGLADAEGIDPRQPLTDMGLDSLMAVELRNLLRAGLELETTLPATIVYDYPTVREMAAYLESQLFFEEPAESESKPPSGAVNTSSDDAMLSIDSIEQLSEDEVDRLFAARLASLEKS